MDRRWRLHFHDQPSPLYLHRYGTIRHVDSQPSISGLDHERLYDHTQCLTACLAVCRKVTLDPTRVRRANDSPAGSRHAESFR
jgi:hypothetical protein